MNKITLEQMQRRWGVCSEKAELWEKHFPKGISCSLKGLTQASKILGKEHTACWAISFITKVRHKFIGKNSVLRKMKDYYSSSGTVYIDFSEYFGWEKEIVKQFKKLKVDSL